MATPITRFNQIGECSFKEFKNVKDLDLNKEYEIVR